jgi:hypothetical protein
MPKWHMQEFTVCASVHIYVSFHTARVRQISSTVSSRVHNRSRQWFAHVCNGMTALREKHNRHKHCSTASHSNNTHTQQPIALNSMLSKKHIQTTALESRKTFEPQSLSPPIHTIIRGSNFPGPGPQKTCAIDWLGQN